MSMRLEKLRQVDFEPSDHIRRDSGGEERHGSSVTAIAEPARRKPSAAARTRTISG